MDAEMVALSETSPARRSLWLDALRAPEFSSLIILCVVLAAFAIGDGKFLSPLNVSNMMAFLPELGIIAIGMTLLLTAGEFDPSVGAVFAPAPAVVMLPVPHAGFEPGTALFRGLSIWITISALDGRRASKSAISSFLTTL